MKILFSLLSFIFLFTVHQPAFCVPKKKAAFLTDSLVWYIYVSGRPDAHYMETSKKVAASWGIHQEYIFGDGSAHGNKTKELEKKNLPTYDYLKKNYGEDWQKKFEQEVHSLLKP